jgi:hypothetical protein
MSVLLSSPIEGELVLVQVRVPSRQLEDALEALASLPFPVNPDLAHAGMDSVIEFPAFQARLASVVQAVQPFTDRVETQSMLTAIQR